MIFIICSISVELQNSILRNNTRVALVLSISYLFFQSLICVFYKSHFLLIFFVNKFSFSPKIYTTITVYGYLNSSLILQNPFLFERCLEWLGIKNLCRCIQQILKCIRFLKTKLDQFVSNIKMLKIHKETECVTYNSIEIHIYAWMNNYVIAVDELSITSFPTASCININNTHLTHTTHYSLVIY